LLPQFRVSCDEAAVLLFLLVLSGVLLNDPVGQLERGKARVYVRFKEREDGVFEPECHILLMHVLVV